jgi:GTPase SAR1 family protein
MLQCATKCYKVCDFRSNCHELLQSATMFYNLLTNCYKLLLLLLLINNFSGKESSKFQESLRLWVKLSSIPLFEEVPFILVLNKSDLFREKIIKHPLSEYFEKVPPGDIRDNSDCETLELWNLKLQTLISQGSDFETSIATFKKFYESIFRGSLSNLTVVETSVLTPAGSDKVLNMLSAVLDSTFSSTTQTKSESLASDAEKYFHRRSLKSSTSDEGNV